MVRPWFPNVANRFQKQTLEWNAKRLRFDNFEEANKYLSRDYREGWDIRGL